jgi:hypothetical protein
MEAATKIDSLYARKLLNFTTNNMACTTMQRIVAKKGTRIEWIDFSTYNLIIQETYQGDKFNISIRILVKTKIISVKASPE